MSHRGRAPRPEGLRGRILCSTSNFPRWRDDSTTPFVLHQASDLKELGWEVEVLAPHAPGAATEEILEGVRAFRFRYLWPAGETVCYGGGALVNLRKDKRNYVKLPPLILSQLASTRRLLHSGRYDLLHTHWALPQGFTGALATRTLDVPHVLTLHGEEFFALQNPALSPFKRIALERADAVTANSASTAGAALSVTPRIRDLRQIPTGVTTDLTPDARLVNQLRERHRTDSGPLLLFCGRLVEEKGVEDAVRAVGSLSGRLPGTSLVVAGAGQDRGAFEALTRELGLADRVAFVGFVSAEEQASYYAAADVFVAPSRTGPDGWIEGQGITPLEAMAVGTPVVGTRIGGYADSILHERTALAVPERSPGAIADAVERIMREPELAERLRNEGHALVQQRFSRRASAAALSELFDGLLGPCDRTRP